MRHRKRESSEDHSTAGQTSATQKTMNESIYLWSGPRNVSTALMYSFRELEEIEIVDEPLYGHYLRVSGADHPGREEILRAMDCNGDRVIQDLLEQQAREPGKIIFAKHMAHHLIDLDFAFLARVKNVFLIRDPREMLPSLTRQLPHATLQDTGLKRQWDLYQELRDAGANPAIVDSRELLLDPPAQLRALCRWLGLHFDSTMLEWNPGPRVEDGVWAKHWYHAVHESSGFSRYRAKTGFPEALQPLLDECRPWYDNLYRHALTTQQAGDADAPA